MALDEDSIAKDLGKLLTPQPLPYRATIKGKIDTVVITSKQELLLALRKYKDQYNQSILTRILLKVADDKESVWHLSEERFDYSEKMAKRLRAMLHDVQQNLTKYKNKQMPEWLEPFTPNEDIAPGQPAFTFGWDDSMDCAYRMRDGSAAKDYADDVEARWDDDGTIWRVPSKGKKGKASEMKADKMKADGMKVETPKKGTKRFRRGLLQQVHWQGTGADGHTVQLKDCKILDKSWLILLLNFGRYRQQICCLRTDNMNAEDRQKSTTKMISIAMRYAEGTIDKDQVIKEKNLLGPEDPTIVFV